MTERELDIVEELRFFAEASDEQTISVVMTSGATFAAAADEIENLRSLINAWVDSRDERVLGWGVDPSLIKWDEPEAALRKAVGR